MNINIGLAKEAMSFQQTQPLTYKTVNDQFEQLIKKKFAAIMSQLQKDDEALYGKGDTWLTGIGGIETISDVWKAPEFVKRVLDYPVEGAEQIYTFFIQAARAEIAKTTGEFDRDAYAYLWTANGDHMLKYDKEMHSYNSYDAFKLDETITLDFFSPYCIKIDGVELEQDPSHIVGEYRYAEAFAIYENIEECISPLYDFPNAVVSLIRHFTRVVVFKKLIAGEEVLFSSASLFPYIGRTLLLNADKASTSRLIDALVHESIHSFLYAIDAVEKWMPSNVTIHKVGRNMISPWTGRPLNPGNFSQAIFVWYGLFNFWQLALANGLYDRDFGERRITQIKKGFQQVDIDLLNNTFNLELKEGVLETVKAVKACVLQHNPVIS